MRIHTKNKKRGKDTKKMKRERESKAHREHVGHLVLPSQIGALVREALVEDVEGELVLGLFGVPQVVLTTGRGVGREIVYKQSIVALKLALGARGTLVEEKTWKLSLLKRTLPERRLKPCSSGLSDW